MSAADLAAVVAAVTCLAVIATLTVMLVRVSRLVEELAGALADVREQTLAALTEATDAATRASDEATRVGEILDTAEAVSSRVDGASKVAYLALSRPVIKTAAAATGARRAARGLRGRA